MDEAPDSPVSNHDLAASGPSVFSRRSFLVKAAQLSLFVLTPLHRIKTSVAMGINDRFATARRAQRLSWLAYRTAKTEGAWRVRKIEGQIPSNLKGTLFRIGPGRKENYGVELEHFFDGDAYVSAFQIDGNKASDPVSAQAKFVRTAAFKDEEAAGLMLYNEYGTAAPTAHGLKYSPNINIVPFDGRLLTFSEGSHPIALDPETLETLGPWNFKGSLPWWDTFSAHPRRDPLTGEMFGFGISKGLTPSLKVFKMDATTGELTQLHSYGLGGFYPVHDMAITRNYLIFAVPPLRISIMKAALGRYPTDQLLSYDPTGTLRIIALRRDGTGEPIVFESQPSGIIFHHCNAYEDESGERIVLHSIMMQDGSALNTFRSWSKEQMELGPRSWIVRFELDLKNEVIVSRQNITDGTPGDFPCVDSRKFGSKVQYVHLLEAHAPTEDPLALNSIACVDLDNGKITKIEAESGHMWGEPLHVAAGTSSSGEEGGWILHPGYAQDLNETYLDVRQPVSMKLLARVWLGVYLPLGFHGSFKPS